MLDRGSCDSLVIREMGQSDETLGPDLEPQVLLQTFIFYDTDVEQLEQSQDGYFSSPVIPFQDDITFKIQKLTYPSVFIIKQILLGQS